MDGLTDKERALAWAAAWNPSLDGVAIVNADFSFRSANPQFYEIIGASPADLIGKSFKDITPEPAKTKDAKNAQMVIEGLTDQYMMQKSYEFLDGKGQKKEVFIVLLVKGVYDPAGKFLFFVSRIMLDEEAERLASQSLETSEGSKIVVDEDGNVEHENLEFFRKYARLIVSAFIGLAAFIWALIQLYMKGQI